jgi:hypothetical protein
MEKLEALRLELDSRRRTVDGLSGKLWAERACGMRVRAHGCGSGQAGGSVAKLAMLVPFLQYPSRP